MITLIAGYRRTGKDTLVKMFNGETPFNWIVYKHPGNDKRFVMKKVKRIGFADKLRVELDTILGTDESIDYDTYKEIIIKDGKTYRDCLRDHAKIKRDQDINYWVRRATEWDKVYSDDRIAVTDWRYINELEYISNFKNLEITTIRLYRSEISIPSNDITSEHQLDNILTDFLLVTSSEEFKKACELFPQYKEFIQINVCQDSCCL